MSDILISPVIPQGFTGDEWQTNLPGVVVGAQGIYQNQYHIPEDDWFDPVTPEEIRATIRAQYPNKNLSDDDCIRIYNAKARLKDKLVQFGANYFNKGDTDESRALYASMLEDIKEEARIANNEYALANSGQILNKMLGMYSKPAEQRVKEKLAQMYADEADYQLRVKNGRRDYSTAPWYSSEEASTRDAHYKEMRKKYGNLTNQLGYGQSQLNQGYAANPYDPNYVSDEQAKRNRMAMDWGANTYLNTGRGDYYSRPDAYNQQAVDARNTSYRVNAVDAPVYGALYAAGAAASPVMQTAPEMLASGIGVEIGSPIGGQVGYFVDHDILGGSGKTGEFLGNIAGGFMGYGAGRRFLGPPMNRMFNAAENYAASRGATSVLYPTERYPRTNYGQPLGEQAFTWDPYQRYTGYRKGLEHYTGRTTESTPRDINVGPAGVEPGKPVESQMRINFDEPTATNSEVRQVKNSPLKPNIVQSTEKQLDPLFDPRNGFEHKMVLNSDGSYTVMLDNGGLYTFSRDEAAGAFSDFWSQPDHLDKGLIFEAERVPNSPINSRPITQEPITPVPVPQPETPPPFTNPSESLPNTMTIVGDHEGKPIVQIGDQKYVITDPNIQDMQVIYITNDGGIQTSYTGTVKDLMPKFYKPQVEPEPFTLQPESITSEQVINSPSVEYRPFGDVTVENANLQNIQPEFDPRGIGPHIAENDIIRLKGADRLNTLRVKSISDNGSLEVVDTFGNKVTIPAQDVINYEFANPKTTSNVNGSPIDPNPDPLSKYKREGIIVEGESTGNGRPVYGPSQFRFNRDYIKGIWVNGKYYKAINGSGDIAQFEGADGPLSLDMSKVAKSGGNDFQLESGTKLFGWGPSQRHSRYSLSDIPIPGAEYTNIFGRNPKSAYEPMNWYNRVARPFVDLGILGGGGYGIWYGLTRPDPNTVGILDNTVKGRVDTIPINETFDGNADAHAVTDDGDTGNETRDIDTLINNSGQVLGDTLQSMNQTAQSTVTQDQKLAVLEKFASLYPDDAAVIRLGQLQQQVIAGQIAPEVFYKELDAWYSSYSE